MTARTRGRPTDRPADAASRLRRRGGKRRPHPARGRWRRRGRRLALGSAAAMAAVGSVVRCALWRGGLRRWYRTERGVYGYKPRKAASGRSAEPRGAGASGKAGRTALPSHRAGLRGGRRRGGLPRETRWRRVGCSARRGEGGPGPAAGALTRQPRGPLREATAPRALRGPKSEGVEASVRGAFCAVAVAFGSAGRSRRLPSGLLAGFQWP